MLLAPFAILVLLMLLVLPLQLTKASHADGKDHVQEQDA